MTDASLVATEPVPLAPGSPLRAWILAARPATLTAAFTPVLVGTACARAVGGFRLGPALAALFGAFCIQIGTNLANDVFDFEKGADTAERLGPTRAVQAGLLSAAAVRRGMIVAFALATLSGVYLTAVAGWPVLAIGAASIASGIAYTGGPYPLGYHGLGDIFVFVFFGLVAVCGTTFVQAGYVPALAVWAALPVGALATCVLVVNNVRDREQDAKAGKRTLAVRLGKGGALLEFGGLLGLAALGTAEAIQAARPPGSALVVVLLIPLLALGVRLLRALWKGEGRPLNAVLKQTALLVLLWGATLSGPLLTVR